MAKFQIKELENVDAWVESDDRLWLAADGETIVVEGDPSAASLFAVPGQRISREDAERYGLLKSRGKQGDKQRVAEGNKDDEAAVDATDGAAELAAEHGVDLASLKGSGKDGRVTKADVEAAVAA